MKDDQQTNDEACSDCYIAGSVSAFRDEHQALLAELAQARKERDAARALLANEETPTATLYAKAQALEAARDHLRARLRALVKEWEAHAPVMIGGNEMIECAADLLAILSELEEAQQTEKEPDHARMDRKADAER